jgi:hypothetical protein
MASKAKPISSTTLQAINDAATKVSVTATSLGSGEGKAYEAWVLMELSSRLKPKHSVQPRDHKGNATTTFRVSRGPSYVPLKSSTSADEPCHFLVAGSLELHSGLRHLGASGDSHELDVSLVCRNAADVLRSASKAAPYDGWTLFGIELKEYDAASTLPKGYARALLGVAVDLTPMQFLAPIEIRLRGLGGRVWSPVWKRTRYFLMTTAPLTGPTKKLLNHHSIGPIENAAVSSTTAALDDVLKPFLK